MALSTNAKYLCVRETYRETIKKIEKNVYEILVDEL